ncbi:MAG: hypothetical protein KKD44_25670, partial [Proteobacteria bacterium]|nr:hypothetical protein [Pseudomonadota bacterium]
MPSRKFVWIIIVPICIYLLSLTILLTGIRPFEGSDATAEVASISESLKNGWDINIMAHNNTSTVLTVLAPFLSKLLNLKPLYVHRNVLLLIFAFTPVLLYFVFKRVMKPEQAIFAALFFIILPPSYQEVPNIGKSMVAQPLAVASFLVLLNYNLKIQVRGIVGAGLIILSATCHYLVGVALLLWWGISSLIVRKKMLLIVVCVASLFIGNYFTFVGNGVVLRLTLATNSYMDRLNDNV